ncbi:MAG: hypothetical protein HZA22_06200 [Nitrospirae bacterium]|nr:hypothetical protein [Nitrospirota bacterium]
MPTITTIINAWTITRRIMAGIPAIEVNNIPNAPIPPILPKKMGIVYKQILRFAQNDTVNSITNKGAGISAGP